MRILVLGGTAFVGRAIVADALAHGFDVTLFSRGLTGSDLFPGVPRLVGDRATGDYSALTGGEWDAVADVSGYVPREVNQAMAVLGDRAGRYVFMSSQAVYQEDWAEDGSTEDTPLRPAVRDTEVLTNATYGPCKVACEEDVAGRYGDRATIVRAGKVAGPWDNQGQFTYWVRQAQRGGTVELAADPEQPVQIVDVRDLARLTVRLVADGRAGAFHAVGPAEPTTLGGLIRTCAEAAGSAVRIVPVEHRPGVPLARPREHWATQRRSAAKARAAGMPATPLLTTAADVLAWDVAQGQPDFV
ncbi:NAD-dependent epimerase/dehydratase family protein [Longispora albida]|uniref:NAD-dependent epimerase/dehydratase family protein n=1 Tax=Longispora albida TaxID=203523 RepID=UPI000686510B|nr:NAD-dependent epimerase/dehydratase family protein [Longispora albida]